MLQAIARWLLHSTLLCLLVWQTSTKPRSIWLQSITIGSSLDLKQSVCWTCLSVVSTSQTSIITFSAGRQKKRERERGKEIQATSHLSHHKKPSSQGNGSSFRGKSEREKDENLSGSNNKEVLPYTSFLNPSPSVAVTSFKSFKSSPTWPMASDPSF